MRFCLHCVLKSHLCLIELSVVLWVPALRVSAVVVDVPTHRCHPDVFRIADDCFVVGKEIVLIGGLFVKVCSECAELMLQVVGDGRRALDGGKPFDGATVLAREVLAGL